jgi:hypothetical protein
MRRLLIVLTLISPALAAGAADNWVPIGPASARASAPLANLGAITVNASGHRVTTIQSKVGAYQLDVLTEFDCQARRTRAQAAAVTSNGQLVSSKGQDDVWVPEAKAELDLNPVCNAALP